MNSYDNPQHHQPVVQFATKKGRRAFILGGAIGFVLAGLFLGYLGASALATHIQQPMGWVYLVVAVLAFGFFGPISFRILKNHVGAKGDISLIMSPAGLTDRTQIVGELPLIPWSMIVGYDAIVFNGQQMLLLQVRDANQYQQNILASSRVMRATFRANTKIFQAPVHAITLQTLQDDLEVLVESLYKFTGLMPGQTRGPNTDHNDR